MKRSVLLILLAVCAASCGSDRPPITGPPPVIEPPPDEPPPDPPDPPTLAFERFMAFGDSLTHGPDQPELAFSIHDHGTPGGSISYPFKLHTILVNTYTDQKDTIQVFNSGQGGEAVSSSKAKGRFLEELPRYKPQVLLLMHGANDMSRPTVTISRIVDHMEELIELARQGGVKHVFLASLPPQVETLGSEKVPEYNKELRKLQSTVVTFVDVFANIDTQTMMQNDGLHLNETGNQKIADLFYAALKAAFHREPQ